MIRTDILKNGYKIIQDTERFQYGIDAVLLADFADMAAKSVALNSMENRINKDAVFRDL